MVVSITDSFIHSRFECGYCRIRHYKYGPITTQLSYLNDFLRSNIISKYIKVGGRREGGSWGRCNHCACWK